MLKQRPYKLYIFMTSMTKTNLSDKTVLFLFENLKALFYYIYNWSYQKGSA